MCTSLLGYSEELPLMRNKHCKIVKQWVFFLLCKEGEGGPVIVKGCKWLNKYYNSTSWGCRLRASIALGTSGKMCVLLNLGWYVMWCMRSCLALRVIWGEGRRFSHKQLHNIYMTRQSVSCLHLPPSEIPRWYAHRKRQWSLMSGKRGEKSIPFQRWFMDDDVSVRVPS